MMISTRGRYALRLMTDLAEYRTDSFIPLKEIALRQEISEKYLEGIVKALVQGGLLSGLRGKNGGYRLTRAPGEYTIYEILRLTEEDLAPVACLTENAEACPRSGTCRTIAMWRRLDRMIYEFFNGITLADLIREN